MRCPCMLKSARKSCGGPLPNGAVPIFVWFSVLADMFTRTAVLFALRLAAHKAPIVELCKFK